MFTIHVGPPSFCHFSDVFGASLDNFVAFPSIFVDFFHNSGTFFNVFEAFSYDD